VDDLTYLKLATLDTADLAIADVNDASLRLQYPTDEMERFVFEMLLFRTGGTKRLWCATEANERSGGEAGDTENS